MNNRQFTMYKKIGFSLFIVYCLLFIGATSANAQTKPADPTQYRLLEPLPFGEAGKPLTEKVSTNTYLPLLFRLVIAIAGVLAVLMLIYGGFVKMSSDSIYGQDEAKKIISNAIWGLMLTLSAWIIVATVIGTKDGKLSLDLSLTPIPLPENNNPGIPGGGTGGTGGGGGVLPGYTLTPEQVAENETIRQKLLQNNPRVRVNAGPCTTGGTSGCTNLVGLPNSAITGVTSLASGCQTVMGSDCNVIVSGGAEGGHETHGPNLPRVDLDKNLTLNKFITEKGDKVNLNTCSRLGQQYRLYGGAIYVDEGDHWHVCY